ncbi:MAG: hypothetical protein JWM59_2174 [Verrucomicrobiales bacterium]|nr:hypothetical protein [Verrucomicrobiales bacterium]
MRFLKWAGWLSFALGLVLFIHGQSMPVYTDPSAPERLSLELQALPREVRSGQWHLKLRSFETGHKWFSDFGRGLMAAAAGWWLARLIWRRAPTRKWLMISWIGLWVLRVPFTWWYYGVRQERFDYPPWGDSIGIPIVSEWIAWLAGGVVTSLILRALLSGRAVPESFRISQPAAPGGWLRSAFLWLWIAALGWLVGEGVYFGDEGMVISGFGAVAVLLRVLSSVRIPEAVEISAG